MPPRAKVRAKPAAPAEGAETAAAVLDPEEAAMQAQLKAKYLRAAGRPALRHQAECAAKLVVEHQRRAARSEGHVGLVHHVTGSGKTHTMLLVGLEELSLGLVDLVILTEPYTTLVEQTCRDAARLAAAFPMAAGPAVVVRKAESVAELMALLSRPLGKRREIVVTEFGKFSSHLALDIKMSEAVAARTLTLVDEAHIGLSNVGKTETVSQAFLGAVFGLQTFRVCFTGTPTVDMLEEYGTDDDGLRRAFHTYIGRATSVPVEVEIRPTPVANRLDEVVKEWEAVKRWPSGRLFVMCNRVEEVKRIVGELRLRLPDVNVFGFHSHASQDRDNECTEAQALATVDIYVAVRRLCAGYEDPRICRVVFWSKVGSDAMVAQCLGRANRCQDGKPQALAVFLEEGQAQAKVATKAKAYGEAVTIPQKPAAAYEAEAVLAERRIDATWPYSTWGRGLFGRLGLLSDAERDRLKKDLVSLLFLQINHVRREEHRLSLTFLKTGIFEMSKERKKDLKCCQVFEAPLTMRPPPPEPPSDPEVLALLGFKKEDDSVVCEGSVLIKDEAPVVVKDEAPVVVKQEQNAEDKSSSENSNPEQRGTKRHRSALNWAMDPRRPFRSLTEEI